MSQAQGNEGGGMMVYQADDLRNWSAQTKLPDGNWVCSRPINYKAEPFYKRISHCWGVLTGKYDALKWEGQ